MGRRYRVYAFRWQLTYMPRRSVLLGARRRGWRAFDCAVPGIGVFVALRRFKWTPMRFGAQRVA